MLLLLTVDGLEERGEEGDCVSFGYICMDHNIYMYGQDHTNRVVNCSHREYSIGICIGIGIVVAFLY